MQMACRQNDVVTQGQVFSFTYIEHSEESDIEAERKSVVMGAEMSKRELLFNRDGASTGAHDEED